MKNVNTIQLVSKYQITQAFAILAATMILPVLIHFLPNINGQLSGAVLLPIFWAPLFATFVYKKHVALFAGIFAPLLNYLILGRPAPEMVITLGFEVVLFVLLLGWLKNFKFLQSRSAVPAYMISSLIVIVGLSLVGNLNNPFSFWWQSMMIAIPGILIMSILNVAILRFRK
ncbi:MAG: hypothetical protein JNK09_12360 [Prolixibacteraceae bacterium]|nr:hypothetical protein [Prolixibacteraceae bacterium]